MPKREPSPFTLIFASSLILLPNYGHLLTIIGLTLSTIASVFMLFPLLTPKKNIDDDFITYMDKKGNYSQKKHLKDKRIAIVGFSLLFIGFIFQLIAVLIT